MNVQQLARQLRPFFASRTGQNMYAGHQLPLVDSTYDLGSNTYKWRYVYADNLVGGTISAHNHADVPGGGQLDWDQVWSDAVHDHSAAGEGGQLDWDSVWSDAVHDHTAAGEGGTLSYANLTSRTHVITGADHSVVGAQYDLVGLSAVNTLGVLTPSSSPGANTLIITDGDGRVQFEGIGIGAAPAADDAITMVDGAWIGCDVTSPNAVFNDTDDAVEVVVTSGAWEFRGAATSPSLKGGIAGNTIPAAANGCGILSGGDGANPHVMTGHYNVICGGIGGDIQKSSGVSDPWYCVITGGDRNQITGDTPQLGFIGGGYQNIITTSLGSGRDVICGGGQNTTTGIGYATVVGGESCHAAHYAFAGGGHDSHADGNYSMVLGGSDCTASGYNAIAYGRQVVAAGDYSMAIGRRALIAAAHDGAFLWADWTDADFNSVAAAEVAFRATGGVRFAYDDGSHVAFAIADTTGAVSVTHTGSAPTWTFNSKVRIDDDLEFVGAQQITTTADNLNIVPAGDLVLDPGGNNVNPGGSIEDDLGAYDTMWRTMYVAELYAPTIVAEDILSTIGGRIVVTPTTFLTSPLGSGAGDLTISCEHNNLADGEFVILMSSPGGVPQVEVLEIDSAPGGGGPYTYTVIRDEDGSGRNAWQSGDAVASLRKDVGQGYIDITSTSTVHADLGPSMTYYVRTATANWNDVKRVVQLGNLNGIVGYASDEFGLGIGQDLDVATIDLLVGATLDRTNGLRLWNTDLAVYDTGTLVFKVDASTPSLAMGATLPTGPLTNDGIWMGLDGSDWEFRVGTITSGALDAGMHWDGTALEIIGSVVVGPGLGLTLVDPVLHLTFDGSSPRTGATYDVSLYGHKGQVPSTESGDIVGWRGYTGKGVLLQEAQTNLCENPVFEVNVTDHWAFWEAGAGGAVARDTTMAYCGSASCKITAGTDSVQMSSSGHSVPDTQTIRFVVAVFVPTNYSGDDPTVFIYDTTTPATRATRTITERGEWVLVHQEWDNDTGGAVSCNGTVRNKADDSTSYFWFDWALVTVNESAPGYPFHGDMPGVTWSGTAHDSTSVWTPYSALEYTLPPRLFLDGSAGTIMIRAALSRWWNEYGTSWGRLFDIRYDGDNRVSITLRAGQDDINVAWEGNNNADQVMVETQTDSWEDFSFHTFVIRWDFTETNTIVEMTVDGGQVLRVTDADPFTNDATTLELGHYAATAPSNCLIDEFIITDEWLSDGQVRLFANATAPAYSTRGKYDLVLTTGDADDGKVVGCAQGIYGYDSSDVGVWALFTADQTWETVAVEAGDTIWGKPDGGVYWHWDLSVGTFTLYDSADAAQVVINTDGQLTAGAGTVILAAGGLSVTYDNNINFNYDFGAGDYAIIGVQDGFGLVIKNYTEGFDGDDDNNDIEIISDHGYIEVVTAEGHLKKMYAETAENLNNTTLALLIPASSDVDVSGAAINYAWGTRLETAELTATGAQVITTAATLQITGAPIAGTNVTITNPLGLFMSADLGLEGTIRRWDGSSFHDVYGYCPLTTALTNTGLDGDAVNIGSYIIGPTGDGGASYTYGYPSDATAIQVRLSAKWGAAADANLAYLRPNGGSVNEAGPVVRAHEANIHDDDTGTVALDSNGRAQLVIAGANTTAIFVYVLGYCI